MRFHRWVLSSITVIVGLAQDAIGTGFEGSKCPTAVQFTSQKFNGTDLRYVKNSGICETTPGVTQYSGYVEVGKNMSMVSFAVV